MWNHDDASLLFDAYPIKLRSLSYPNCSALVRKIASSSSLLREILLKTYTIFGFTLNCKEKNHLTNGGSLSGFIVRFVFTSLEIYATR